MCALTKKRRSIACREFGCNFFAAQEVKMLHCAFPQKTFFTSCIYFTCVLPCGRMLVTRGSDSHNEKRRFSHTDGHQIHTYS